MGYTEHQYLGHPHMSTACRAVEAAVRVLALLLSIAGAAVMAKDKQVTTIFVGTVPVPLYARHSYVEAFVFLVYANGIVAIYSFISLAVSFFTKGRALAGVLFIMDQTLAYLLLAAAAASTEVSYVAKRGEEKLVWAEVCSNFERFCNRVGISLVLTFLCVLCLVALAVISGRRLFGHSGRYDDAPASATSQPCSS